MRRHLTASIAIATIVLTAAGAAHADDPTTADCLSASDASLKLGNQHKLRAERAQLLVCAAPSCPSDVRKECARRVDELNGQIPTIIFAAKDAATGADLSAVRVTIDGDVLAERLEGTALSIDPGEHTFAFETAGQPTVTRKLLIAQAQKDRRETIAFGSAPSPSTTGSDKLPASTGGQGLGTQRVLAIVAAGVGVVGLGIGATFGLVAMSKKSDAQIACPNACATQDGVSKWSDASSMGNVATVGFIVGGVAVAGAAVLWFTAPSTTGARTQVGFGPTGFSVRGTW